ncbi:hypothetical protein [Actinokineospora globicatena]|uniref:hypothetical protein n=1 Tax=Actinokineospora globicatena TaxID=103729 RepID=UPI0020A2CE83|nr:hypothetical protein [Actinokineospora globicatena]MCP2305146.1 hypothetical protein [Actinokineospora globicatena]GLW80614.1 hypothetical protein Aglo01_50950 [Actinokineospora globicatena]GLW87442.1 hypothetical protein Aglo02_50810 [Actinokineospora globicatena]
MYEPILANYTARGTDWTVEVRAKGQTKTATAPDLVTARDRADELIEDMLAGDKKRTVVHTLDGDAVGFTAAYLTARLGLAEPVATIPAQARADKAPVPPPAAMA